MRGTEERPRCRPAARLAGRGRRYRGNLSFVSFSSSLSASPSLSTLPFLAEPFLAEKREGPEEEKDLLEEQEKFVNFWSSFSAASRIVLTSHSGSVLGFSWLVWW
uniref:Uncharacterized protein n=1 Tax=Arundo donax TaxID=35708 RepID=A0A0A9GH65_ARUDO